MGFKKKVALRDPVSLDTPVSLGHLQPSAGVGGLTDVLRSKLEERLKVDYVQKRLTLNIHGGICRAHYAKLLGADTRWLGFLAADIYQRYQKKCRDDFLGLANHVLTEAMSSGTMPVVATRVARGWICGSLGIEKHQYQRDSDLKALVGRFDEVIASGRYLGEDRSAVIKRLKSALGNACPLGRSGKVVSRQAIAKKIGVKLALLKQHPFKAFIAQKNKELAAGYGLGNGNVLVGKQVVSFRKLIGPWSRQFVKKIGDAFVIFAHGYSDKGTQHACALRKLLLWIPSSKNSKCESFVSEIEAGKLPNSNLWDDILHDYSEERLKNNSNRETLRTEFGSTNAALRHLSAVGILPTFENPLRVPREHNDPHRASHLRSVAEVSRRSELEEQIVEYAQGALIGATEKLGSTYTAAGAQEFLRCLAEEFSRKSRQPPKSLPAAVLSVLNERLELIKTKAAELVNASRTMLTVGRELLTLSNLPENFLSDVNALAYDSPEQSEMLKKYYPESGEVSDRRLNTANLLNLVVTSFGGVFPSLDYEFKKNQFPNANFFRRAYNAFGGRRALQDHLLPSDDAKAAISVLYQCEAGANVSVALTLGANCLRNSDLAGYSNIVGHKMRAGGKPIYADLRTKEFCVQSMVWIRECGKPLREAAPRSASELLFVAIRGDRLTGFNSNWYREWFKEFINSIDELRGLRILPSMLRPSILLKAAIEGDGRVLVGMAVAQHSLNVSEGYQAKHPVRQQRDGKMRGFQHFFESLALVHAASVSVPSGFTAAEISERQEALAPTGLGTFCKDRFGKPGHEGRQCNDLTCAGDMCPQMEVVLDSRSAAQMQMWKASLESAAPEWERDRPERWEKLWLPWLCLISVVEEKATRGVLLKVWDEGHELRRQAEKHPAFKTPSPW